MKTKNVNVLQWIVFSIIIIAGIAVTIAAIIYA